MNNSLKLILHSDQSPDKTGDIDSKLIRSLTGKRNPRIGYIPSTADPRRKYFKEKFRYYEKIGFTEIEYFDPEEEHSEDQRLDFFKHDLIHLSGGAVGSFMDRLRLTGCDSQLRNFVQRGGVILGVSAGAMLLGKTFRTASLFGEQGTTEGLGFFDFEVIPHVSEHFPRLDGLRMFAGKIGQTIYALNDGDIVVLSGKKISTYGSPVKIDP